MIWWMYVDETLKRLLILKKMRKKKLRRRDHGAHRHRLASRSKCDHRASVVEGQSYWTTLPSSSLSIKPTQLKWWEENLRSIPVLEYDDLCVCFSL